MLLQIVCVGIKLIGGNFNPEALEYTFVMHSKFPVSSNPDCP